MSRLEDRQHAYADQNVWLQCLLGIVSETTWLAQALRRPVGGRRPAPLEIDPFVAALLGLLSVRAEIGAAARESAHRPTRAATAPDDGKRRRSRRVPRKPRDLMR